MKYAWIMDQFIFLASTLLFFICSLHAKGEERGRRKERSGKARARKAGVLNLLCNLKGKIKLIIKNNNN